MTIKAYVKKNIQQKNANTNTTKIKKANYGITTVIMENQYKVHMNI